MNKTCTKCLQELPVEKFSKKRAQCKQCIYQIKRERNKSNPQFKLRRAIYARRWRLKPEHYAKNRERQRKYQEELRAIKISRRPAKTPCPTCGSLDHLKWHRRAYLCIKCLRAASKARDAAKSRSQRIQFQYRKIFSLYGQSVADKYKAWAESCSRPTNISRLRLNELCLPQSLKPIGLVALERIEMLNRIGNYPPGNIGWNCQKCKVSSEDWGFFDIDHIIAKHRQGTGIISNLQILCPNCHRIKCRAENKERLSKLQASIKAVSV